MVIDPLVATVALVGGAVLFWFFSVFIMMPKMIKYTIQLIALAAIVVTVLSAMGYIPNLPPLKLFQL